MNVPPIIRVIVIDDEPLARSMIVDYLSQNPNFKVITECGDGFEGAKAILEHKPDLVFLDIQMPKISGFEMLELLDVQPHVIFTTAFDEYAVKAFEKHAVDYLLKPISQTRFDQALVKFMHGFQNGNHPVEMEKLKEATSSNWKRFVVRTGNRIKIIPVEEIIHIQADDDYIQIITVEGSFLKKETLTNCEKNLDQMIFARTHRSHLLNILHLDRLEPYEKENYLAILKTGQKIPVSKNGYSKLRQILEK